MRLTQTVQKGGCAAKVAASELRQILSQVRFPAQRSELLIDGGTFDDAAIYQVSPDLALVQTLDFFTPIVDTPRIFGQVAAANALSDVFAMGGTPQTAMAILAFPLAQMESSIAVEVLQGACDVLAELNTPLVGGHSIDDDTLKFGLSVTGYVHPKRIWSNAGAQKDDVLILTKALGTGTLTAALKRSHCKEEDIAEAVHSMVQVNQVLDLLSDSESLAVHAATDITGFGLLGHALNMALASRHSFQLLLQDLPMFSSARECLEQGFLTKAHRTNKEYVTGRVQWTGGAEWQQQLLFDPQTSGGLLLSVAAAQAPAVLRKLQARFTRAAIIGRVSEMQEHALVVS